MNSPFALTTSLRRLLGAAPQPAVPAPWSIPLPGAESHSGQIFTCVAALSIAGAVDDVVDADLLGWWCVVVWVWEHHFVWVSAR